MTPKQSAHLVALLAAAFPCAPITEATSQAYEWMLADLDFDATKQAVLRLIATSRFFPTIAEIRTAATDLALGPRRQGGEGWSDVLAEIRRVGAYEAPRFADPIVAKCVQAMGWRHLCLSPSDAADRARFIQLYDELAERARRDAVAGPAYALPPAGTRRQLPAGRKGELAPLGRMLGAGDSAATRGGTS